MQRTQNSQNNLKKEQNWRWLGGVVVGFVHLLQWPRVHQFGSWMWTYTLLIKPCCGSIPHRRTRRTYNWDIQLYTRALGGNKLEEDWQQLLGQSQSEKKIVVIYY